MSIFFHFLIHYQFYFGLLIILLNVLPFYVYYLFISFNKTLPPSLLPPSPQGQSALFAAVESGSAECVQYLLQVGLSPNTTNLEGRRSVYQLSCPVCMCLSIRVWSYVRLCLYISISECILLLVCVFVCVCVWWLSGIHSELHIKGLGVQGQLVVIWCFLAAVAAVTI